MVLLEIMLFLEHGDIAGYRWCLCSIASYSFATAFSYVGAALVFQTSSLGANYWHINIPFLDGMD